MGATEGRGVKKERTVSEISKLLKISAKELKQFEEEGVFDYTDKKKKTVDEKNFQRLRAAVSLSRELGVNPAGVDIILNLREKLGRLRSDVNDFLGKVRDKLEADLERKSRELEEKLNRK